MSSFGIKTQSSGGGLSAPVSYAEIQNVSATQRVLGRNSSGAGVIEEVTPAQLLSWLNLAGNLTMGRAYAMQKGAALP